jgi:hypothetical protein
MAKVNQATASALSGLEFAIRATVEQPKADDEFTIREFIAGLEKSGSGMSYSKASDSLKKLVDEGKLTVRNARNLGKRTWLYRKA